MPHVKSLSSLSPVGFRNLKTNSKGFKTRVYKIHPHVKILHDYRSQIPKGKKCFLEGWRVISLKIMPPSNLSLHCPSQKKLRPIN